MLLRFIRESDGNEGRGKPVGVILATGKRKIGISLCHKNDCWNKEIGILKAKARAENSNLKKFLKKLKSEKLKNRVIPVLEIMKRAIKKYDFKKEK